jgi:hypothetical protein
VREHYDLDRGTVLAWPWQADAFAGKSDPSIPKIMTYLRGSVRVAAGLSAVAVVLAAIAPPQQLEAQSFGRNKVQYEDFDFRIYRSDHFDVHFYPEFAAPATDATRMLERWYGRLSGILDYEFGRNPIVLYANHPDFQQTNVIGGELSEGTGGVTESIRTRVVLPLTGVYADNDHVLGHELVHVFQYEMAGSSRGGGLPNLSRLPLWVIEGLAEYLSVGRVDAHTSMWLRDALLRDDLPTISDLSRQSRYFPYRYGQAVWAYIGGRFGDRRAAELYRVAARVGEFERAMPQTIGVSADSLSDQWHAAVGEQFSGPMASRSHPDSVGRVLISNDGPGSLNISPVISPDGRYLAFYSQRGLFSVDLFLADAATGRVLKTLASPTSGHFDNLSFINTAGAWSPDSRKLAYIVFSDGDSEVHILDVDSRNVERKIRTPGLGSVSGLTWSPDGTRIALAGIAGGVGELFVMNADGSNLTRLTNDKFAALHPAWSPDGRYIAYATDGGPGANLDILVTMPMRIALLDVATRETRILPGFPEAKNINPQFSPDGSSLYFISDVGGFSDIFRLNLASSAVNRVTHVKTGVSGITYLSPAMSVSGGSGNLVYSIFTDGGTRIHTLDASAAVGTPVAVTRGESQAGATLPPEISGVVDGYLADNTTYLPAATSFPVRPYSPRLGLDYIGEPTIGFAASDFGGGFFGSVSAYFGDMLGNRSLGVGVTGEGNIQDFGAQAFYLNRSNRLNWGVAGGRVPYASGFTVLRDTVVGGAQALVYDQVIQRAFFDEFRLFSQYPFSTTRRIEINAGVTRVSYRSEVQRWLEFSNGFEGPIELPAQSPPSISYAQGAVALVGDNSFAGFTSPIAGARYRFEASPTFGGINFVALSGDARKYFLANPVTFAFRGLHYGRYGRDSEDNRLQPLYVGNDQLVRGYSIHSFTADECTTVGGAASGCPEFNRLVGSRIAVANAELRLAFLGSPAYGLIPTSFIPIELSAFADAGMAWTTGESVDLRFERNTPDRVPVISTGLSARFNLFGFAVAELFYAMPWQRPTKSGVWGFQFVPGW